MPEVDRRDTQEPKGRPGDPSTPSQSVTVTTYHCPITSTQLPHSKDIGSNEEEREQEQEVEPLSSPVTLILTPLLNVI